MTTKETITKAYEAAKARYAQLVLTLMRFLKNCKMSKSLCIAGKVMMSKDFDTKW